MECISFLNVIASESNHDPAIIVGNKKGLQTLAAALNAVLLQSEDNSYSSKLVVASDGEGYDVVVIKRADIRDVPACYLADVKWETLGYPTWLTQILVENEQEKETEG
jgi:hypothetical protein